MDSRDPISDAERFADDKSVIIPFPVSSGFGTQPDPLAGMPPLLRAMRPLQWTKNLIVFAALVFSRQVFELDPFLSALGAFICFCAASSAVYLFNDLGDLDLDRLHPEKKYRPIAAGELEPRTGGIAAIALALGSLLAAIVIDLEFAGVLLAYLVLMLAYNMGLKKVVFVDVFAIAAGFLLRAAGGAVVIDVPVSPWLYLCTLLLALFLGFGKRRHELITMQGAAHTRPSLESYSVPVLDQVIGIVATAAILAYAIYTFDSPNMPDNHAMLLTVPIVAYAIFRYLFLVYRRDLGGSPEMVLATDKPIMASVILWAIACVTILTLSF